MIKNNSNYTKYLILLLSFVTLLVLSGCGTEQRSSVNFAESIMDEVKDSPVSGGANITASLLGKKSAVSDANCHVRVNDFKLLEGSPFFTKSQASKIACQKITTANYEFVVKSICLNSNEEGNASIYYGDELLESRPFDCTNVVYDDEDKCTIAGKIETIIAEDIFNSDVSYEYVVDTGSEIIKVDFQDTNSTGVKGGNINALGVHRGKNLIVRDDSDLQYPNNRDCELGEASGIDTVTVEGSTVESTTPVPAYHANPGATKVIFLDFDGHTTISPYWNGGNPVVSPSYDIDGDSSTFSAAELARIHEIWDRVSEDFAPFDVDVTTEEPPTGDLLKESADDVFYGIRVVITGESSWYGSAGGVAYVNSFNWNTDTPVFVFENKLGNGVSKYVAEASSHEAGHALNLRHHSSSAAAYCVGGNEWAPIMGLSYYETHTTWHNGDGREGCNYPQSDLDILSTRNGFDYIGDDFGNTKDTAHVLTPSGSTLSATGVISEMSDVDVFRFTAGDGAVEFSVIGDRPSQNLDVQIELRDSQNILLANSDETTTLDATINSQVTQGDYYLFVKSNGDYGELGQYVISGTINSDVSCTSQEPLIQVTPTRQEGMIGDVRVYDVSVTNTDIGNCAQTEFAITFVEDSELVIDKEVVSVSLQPGDVYETQLSVTANSPAAGLYSVLITANGNLESTARAEYNIVSCNYGKPSLSITPVSTGATIGQEVSYTLSLRNTDGVYCPTSTFRFNTTTDVGLTSTFTSDTLTLEPNEIKSTIVKVNSNAQTSNGENTFTVFVQGAESVHATSISGKYVVDTQAPSIPTGVTLSKKGKTTTLRWSPSTDNVGVVYYNVYINDVVAVQTAQTSYSHRADGTDSYHVRAYDAAGNPSLSSEQVTLTGTGGKNGGSKAHCDDGIDNDGDGTCDYAGCNIGKGKKNSVWFPPDTSCESTSDTSEAS